MEEIILKAKAGPPVSRLVGNHVEVTKGLVDASIVETHKKRRITGKQSLNANMVRRELLAVVQAAKKKTKREGKQLMDETVVKLVTLANKQGADIKAKFIDELQSIAVDLTLSEGDPTKKEKALKRIFVILRANGVID